MKAADGLEPEQDEDVFEDKAKDSQTGVTPKHKQVRFSYICNSMSLAFFENEVQNMVKKNLGNWI